MKIGRMKRKKDVVLWNVGDKVRLRQPTDDELRRELPYGDSPNKRRWMNEKTIYTINRIVQGNASKQRIYLEGVENESTEWSFTEHFMLPANENVNELVYNVLRGLK
jgi:hypothetical protein